MFAKMCVGRVGHAAIGSKGDVYQLIRRRHR